jgi:hypothetical protein
MRVSVTVLINRLQAKISRVLFDPTTILKALSVCLFSISRYRGSFSKLGFEVTSIVNDISPLY